ncbi:GLPGLI family protein [Pedobacter borealis]|uniref:GLPGLI family protein n=1 Tax=Pedobacter borealis TaxID=475254 RepID=UPI00068D5A46|nr:GLPGLI family protein [Pedobacter borealis]
MKIFYIIITSLLIFSCPVVAQNKGILYYKLTTNDKRTHNPRTENYQLFFAGDKSIQFFMPQVVKEEFKQIDDNTGGKTVVFNTKNNNLPFLFKDFRNHKIILTNNIQFKDYLINDTLVNFDWKITNERKQILKYTCIKATTKFRGREYEAWFTEDVPTRVGPWKFNSLPGLIVKVNDIDNIYTFELTAADFETKFDPRKIAVPENSKKDSGITHRQFIELYAKKVKDLEAQSRASYVAKGNVTGITNITIPPLMEKF